MCFPKPKKQKFQPTPQPEKAAEALEIGAPRQEEDEALFGGDGQPNLSVNRDSIGKGVVAGGSGLRMM